MWKEIKIWENENILNKCKKYINYTNVLENIKFCKDFKFNLTDNLLIRLHYNFKLIYLLKISIRYVIIRFDQKLYLNWFIYLFT